MAEGDSVPPVSKAVSGYVNRFSHIVKFSPCHISLCLAFAGEQP